ncbi:MAG: hypothetical protein MI757_14235 [Pirellulales bacterium]|nr:hypothetical protein [Pirellulales bacterium]
MLDKLNQQLANLRKLNLSIRQGLEKAELYIPKIDHQLEQLFAIGLLEQQMLLGDIVHETNYRKEYGPHDSNRVHLAALGIGFGGIGIVSLDSEHYWLMVNFDGPLDMRVTLNHTSFEQCAPGVRALILPQVEYLVRNACQLIRS